MFCPKCGHPDQSPETFCRKCGTYLPDLAKAKKPLSPQEHIRANLDLTVMSGVMSISMAAVMLSYLLRDQAVPMILCNIIAGLLIANFAWQVQTFIRTRMLKKQLPITVSEDDDVEDEHVQNQLVEADFENVVPPSVTDRTTSKLAVKK
ncbi:MAG: zinc ribbon domain-containing protein [Acidobacteria bacterium]|nr:zinc ribbon domain-containing protein [Acidobacteriota bacterium]